MNTRPCKPARRARLEVEILEDRLTPSTFVVNTVSDSGPGSLRQAMLNANTSPGADTIAFAIGTGAQSIAPTSALPTLTGPTTVSGNTQPGFAGTPLIELNGAGAGAGVSGLVLKASGAPFVG